MEFDKASDESAEKVGVGGRAKCAIKMRDEASVRKSLNEK